VAKAYAHQFGQIIGEVLERAIQPLLEDFSKTHGLYLDSHGFRPARKTKKVTWKDRAGNLHDLDFVLERGGSSEKIGSPVAFIETAWRSYTKHSRNKAQEIQGAIIPLVETYRNSAPFIGVILAGVFTTGALGQLRSLGFSVLYFSHPTILDAFKTVGIDAGFDEKTPEAQLRRKLRAWKLLPARKQNSVSREILRSHSADIKIFVDSLAKSVSRRIVMIRILPLHGKQIECPSLQEAIQFVLGYHEEQSATDFVRFEIQIQYNNGDRIEANFGVKDTAIQFLNSFSGQAP